MVDPITIAGALALVKGAMDSAKSLQELLKTEKPDISALRHQIQLLREQLLDAKDGLLEMREVNQDLVQKIAELKARNATTQETPVRLKDYYYFPKADGTVFGPCCSSCWDDKQKKITLTMLDPRSRTRLDQNVFKCNICQSSFSSLPPKPEEIQSAMQD